MNLSDAELEVEQAGETGEHVDDLLVAFSAAQGDLGWVPGRPQAAAAPAADAVKTEGTAGEASQAQPPAGASGAYSMTTAALLAAADGCESSDWESSDDDIVVNASAKGPMDPQDRSAEFFVPDLCNSHSRFQNAYA